MLSEYENMCECIHQDNGKLNWWRSLWWLRVNAKTVNALNDVLCSTANFNHLRSVALRTIIPVIVSFAEKQCLFARSWNFTSYVADV